MAGVGAVNHWFCGSVPVAWFAGRGVGRWCGVDASLALNTGATLGAGRLPLHPGSGPCQFGSSLHSAKVGCPLVASYSYDTLYRCAVEGCSPRFGASCHMHCSTHTLCTRTFCFAPLACPNCTVWVESIQTALDAEVVGNARGLLRHKFCTMSKWALTVELGIASERTLVYRTRLVWVMMHQDPFLSSRVKSVQGLPCVPAPPLPDPEVSPAVIRRLWWHRLYY